MRADGTLEREREAFAAEKEAAQAGGGGLRLGEQPTEAEQMARDRRREVGGYTFFFFFFWLPFYFLDFRAVKLEAATVASHWASSSPGCSGQHGSCAAGWALYVSFVFFPIWGGGRAACRAGADGGGAAPQGCASHARVSIFSFTFRLLTNTWCPNGAAVVRARLLLLQYLADAVGGQKDLGFRDQVTASEAQCWRLPHCAASMQQRAVRSCPVHNVHTLRNQMAAAAARKHGSVPRRRERSPSVASPSTADRLLLIATQRWSSSCGGTRRLQGSLTLHQTFPYEQPSHAD